MRKRLLNTIFSLVLIAVGLGAISGCGGGGSSGGPAPLPNTAGNEVQALSNYMQDYYFWYRQIPTADLSAVTTADEALKLLKFSPTDRYSYIDTAASFNAFFQEGKSTGAGFGMREANNQVFIEYVRPASPAQAAGLLRGDRIVKANGVDATTIASIDSAIGPREIGFALSLQVDRQGSMRTIDMVKASYDIITVSDARLIDNAGRKVAYLYFYAFIDRTNADWASAVNSLRAQGAQDIIVDLRHNGGGYLATAGQIGSTLKATLPSAGQYLTRLMFNDKHTSENSNTAFGNDVGSRFSKVVFLTSEGSCSASEALINGLSAGQNVISIGSKTCGKPVGFTPRTSGTKVFSIVTFDLRNSVNSGGYYDGLAPTCPITDTFVGNFGDSNEPLLAGALSYLRFATCPIAQGPNLNEKKIQPRPSINQIINRGVDSQFGLY